LNIRKYVRPEARLTPPKITQEVLTEVREGQLRTQRPRRAAEGPRELRTPHQHPAFNSNRPAYVQDLNPGESHPAGKAERGGRHRIDHCKPAMASEDLVLTNPGKETNPPL
jgi:hypothetical protein